MEWKDNEIIGSYKRSGRRKAQIKIIAECNGCSTEQITDVLKRAGAYKDETPAVEKRKPKKKTEDRRTKTAAKQERECEKMENTTNQTVKEAPAAEQERKVVPFCVIEACVAHKQRLERDIKAIEKKLEEIREFLKGVDYEEEK